MSDDEEDFLLEEDIEDEERQDYFDQAIDIFRNNGKSSDGYILLTNSDALTIINFWDKVKITRLGILDSIDTDLKILWEKLWELVEVDDEGLRNLCNMTPETFNKSLEQLIIMRLVFPNGSIAKIAEAILQSRVIEAIEPLTKQNKKKHKEEN